MRIVVCVKEVADPDAVHIYALTGRLVIGEDGKTLTQASIPRLMNAYDEQAIEAALRLRDAGVDCRITAVTVGTDANDLLKHAVAQGADDIVAIAINADEADGYGVASALAAFVRGSGGADLILCGREASDDDQGVVPSVLGELLGLPVVAMARAISTSGPSGGWTVRVTRVTPEGDEVVEARCPAVVTISNELGQPRYPTAARMILARRTVPMRLSASELGLTADALRPRVVLERLFVPAVQGNCELISGATAAELADRLVVRLRGDRVLPLQIQTD